MKIMVVVATRAEAELLNKVLAGQGSRAFIPGDATMGTRFDKIMVLCRLEGKGAYEWYVTQALTRIACAGVGKCIDGST